MYDARCGAAALLQPRASAKRVFSRHRLCEQAHVLNITLEALPVEVRMVRDYGACLQKSAPHYRFNSICLPMSS